MPPLRHALANRPAPTVKFTMVGGKREGAAKPLTLLAVRRRTVKKCYLEV
jgi:hypothetical protein